VSLFLIYALLIFPGFLAYFKYVVGNDGLRIATFLCFYSPNNVTRSHRSYGISVAEVTLATHGDSGIWCGKSFEKYGISLKITFVEYKK
jgi:hypothetical protein